MNGKCLIIYNEPASNALPDELDVLDQVDFIQEILEKLGYQVERQGITENFYNEIESISGQGYEFVFNLVESIGKNAEVLYFIPGLLNLYNIPYTGCPVEATFVTASKVLARNIMRANRIPVAGGYKVSEASQLVTGKRYILKPVWEDGSLGITEDSVFTFDGSIPEILRNKDDQHWFIEDFIEGREFNVSVMAGPNGPEMLPPAEMLFIDYPENIPRIVSYRAKWEEDSFQYENSRRSFPDNLSDKLLHNLRAAVNACWHTFGLKGYARVDIRVDQDENVYVLEVNANPCISPDSGFISAAVHAGCTHREIVMNILNDLNR
ncbi:MAG TPA: ATP-grasp domain-containing protein [Bacteroidales bacterium]|nr:ATP-grasp domain-containing protein [Bacteroidales bacterium]